MLESLKKVFSFRYNDRPLSDSIYEANALWIKFFHDFYFRVEHTGRVRESLETAKRNRVIFITNHALTFEAALLGYYLLAKGAGKISTLVFPEAFKLPLIREFFRSCHCLPISITRGASALKQRNILLYPEGMDFIRGLADPERMPPFHTGFLRIAQKFLSNNGHRKLTIVPIAHAGVEKTAKFWLIKNNFLLDLLVRPFANFPFWAVPKLPFLLPYKVIMTWGKPVTLTLKDIKTDRKIDEQAERFRLTIHELRTQARDLRENYAEPALHY